MLNISDIFHKLWNSVEILMMIKSLYIFSMIEKLLSNYLLIRISDILNDTRFEV